TRARIGMRALAANRERTTVTQAAVAAKVHQTLDVHRDFTTQVTFNLVVAVNRFTNLKHFGVGELIHTTIEWDTDLLNDLSRKLRADAVDVLQRNDHALVGRNVNAGYTCHLRLHLAPAVPALVIVSRVRWRPALARSGYKIRRSTPMGERRVAT